MKLLIAIFSLCSITVLGQTNRYVGFTAGLGAVVPEYSNATLTSTSPNSSFALSLYRRTNGSHNDEQLLNCPDGGILLQVQTLGNQQVNGTEIAGVFFTRLHLLRERKWNLLWQLGLGISGVTRKYDALKNPENVAIGSYMNIHFNSQFLFAYEFNRLGFQAGIAFDHLSNGNLSEPNLGINSAYITLGSSYRLNDEKVTERFGNPEKSPIERISIIAAVGGKHARALADNFFFTCTVTGDYLFLSKRRFSTAIGPDFFYDASVPTELAAISKDPESARKISSGIHITEFLRYKKWLFGLQLGVYVGFPEPINNKPMYTRGILQYAIGKHWSARIAMKSHLHILEYPEFGIGYRWLSK